MPLSCPHQPHASRMCAVPQPLTELQAGGRLGPASADTTVGWTPCQVGSGDTRQSDWSLPGGVHSVVDDRPHCRMTAWLPVCLGRRVTRGCGECLTGRWKSEGGSQGRWHRSSGIPHRKGRVPSAGGRGNTGSEVRKQELSGVQSGWSRDSSGVRRLGLCRQGRCWTEHLEPRLWTVRSRGRREDLQFQSFGCNIRATIPECPLVPRTVLMIIITMFIEHSLGIELYFSEFGYLILIGTQGGRCCHFYLRAD